MTRRKPARRRARAALGTVELLPSGRWRASYRRDGRKFTAPHTFATRAEGDGWLAAECVDRARGVWVDPAAGRVTVAEYARTWLDARPELAPRTREHYGRTMRRWIVPRVGDIDGARGVELGTLPVGDLTPAVVRAWYAAIFRHAHASAAEHLAGAGEARRRHPARAWARSQGMKVAAQGRMSPAVIAAWETAGRPAAPAPVPARSAGQTTAAHAYRILRAVLNTAVQDGLLPANPCQIRGAGQTPAKERGTATPADVAAIAAHMPARYAAAVTLAAWSGLRFGELFALARRHVDLQAGTVRVERALEQVPGRPVGFGKPKTAKSRRTVHLPAFVTATLAQHIAEHVEPGPDALLFPLADGTPMRNATLSRYYRAARAVAGCPELRWHDLRHTGATLAYRAGASVPEVQARLGHTTMRAALIYAHTADDSDRVLAERLDALYAASTAGTPTLRAVG